MYVLKNLTDVFIIYYLFVSGAEMVKKIESMNIDLSEPLNVCSIICNDIVLLNKKIRVKRFVKLCLLSLANKLVSKFAYCLLYCIVKFILYRGY